MHLLQPINAPAPAYQCSSSSLSMHLLQPINIQYFARRLFLAAGNLQLIF
uniref:Uncharacterized protein n=1 Tax=Anguilla anguilla TaxID=7936 RepID=A0A0E9XC94_ANGAN